MSIHNKQIVSKSENLSFAYFKSEKYLLYSNYKMSENAVFQAILTSIFGKRPAADYKKKIVLITELGWACVVVSDNGAMFLDHLCVSNAMISLNVLLKTFMQFFSTANKVFIIFVTIFISNNCQK